MQQRAGGDGKAPEPAAETGAFPSQPARSARTVHAFGDDALGDHDATMLAELVLSRQVSPPKLASAAVARAYRMQPLVNGVHHPDT